jgi:hypothetical protein
MANRSSGNKLVKRTVIEDNRSQLLNAPIKEREEFSMGEAVNQIAHEITEVLSRGYSYDEIAIMLSNGGMNIKGTTLRQYMTAIKRNSTKGRQRKKINDVKKVTNDTHVSASVREDKEKKINNTISKAAPKTSKLPVKVKDVSKESSDGFVDMPDEL